MEPARRLVYRFLALPYHIIIKIAGNLDLIRDAELGDKGLDDIELFQQFFRRANADSKLKDLWIEVEKAHGSEITNNPFE